MTTSDPGFGIVLKQLRLAAGLTQEALAELAGVSPRAISDLERDPRRAPRLDTVTLLADALKLDDEHRRRLMSAARPVAVVTPPPHRAFAKPLTAIVGRAGTTAALVEVLRRDPTRLLTLTGPGGVGKTRLAIEVASQVEGDFREGVYFVDLAPLRDSNLVVAAIATQLGIEDRDATPLSDRLAAALRHRNILLLLDNFEHVIDARTSVLDLLTTCPSVRTMITSRVPLRVRGEREYRLAPLEISSAISLFGERARDAGIGLPADAAGDVAEICRRLEGIPLAIELAAARLRVLSPAALLARLTPRLALLSGGPRDLPDRHKTMRDAIDWSYQLLSNPEQELFRALSVFVGGGSLDAVGRVCRVPVERLERLTESSLVIAQQERISMLETIREFGIEQLEAVGEAGPVHRRHAAYYAEFAEGAKQPEAEHDNLRAALRWTLTNGDGEQALRLVGALWPFWLERGYLTEGRRWLAAALALDGGGRVGALIGAARLAIEQSDFVEAHGRAEQAVALGRSASATDLAKALNVRGNLARGEHRYADAIRDHEAALSILDDVSVSGELAQRAGIVLDLSYDEFAVGKSDMARELAERALETMRELGDMRGIGNALVALAWQKQKHDLVGAEAVAQEALTIFEDLNDPGRVGEILRQLGTIAQFQGRFESSLQFHERAHQLYRDRGDERIAAQLLSHMSHTALGLGDAQRARSLAEESLRIARMFNDRWTIAISTTQLGHLALGEHRLEPARAHFSESARTFQEIGNPIYLSWCVEGLAAIALADGRTDIAAKLCAAREALLERLGSRLPPMVPEAHAKTLAAAGKSATVEPLPDLIVQSLNG